MVREFLCLVFLHCVGVRVELEVWPKVVLCMLTDQLLFPLYRYVCP